MIDTEAKADLIAVHMDRCTEAMAGLRSALENWHASVVLERHSEPERWGQVKHAHCVLRAALAALREAFPEAGDDDDDDDDDDGIDRTWDEAAP